MGGAFERWLAKPGTLHFLRRLVVSDSLPISEQIITPINRKAYRRFHADVTKAIQEDEHRIAKLPDLLKNISRKNRREDSINTSQLGPRMSQKSGAAMLDTNFNSSEGFAELTYQADVNSGSKLGKLLVDEPSTQENAQLWVEILRFRQRIDGFAGVSDVWQGMRMRGVDLPVEGPEADVMWTTFTRSCIIAGEKPQRKRLLWEVFEHAKELKARKGLQYSGLYKSIIGRCFRVRLQDVAMWHDRLNLAGLVRPKDVASVAVDVHRGIMPRSAFGTWTQLQHIGDGMHLYDIAIGEVSRLEDSQVTLRWHKWLVRHGHFPSTEMLTTLGVQKLFDLDQNRSLPMLRPETSRDTETTAHTGTSKAKLPRLTRESMNTIVGDVHGIQPKEISDSFCAKLFATRAFSLDLVIKGLSFLGIERLGPLTVREMTVRTGTPAEFLSKLADLNKLGVSLGKSVFAQLVSKAACSGDDLLWNALLENDQHPDVYEDARTQEALLMSFLQQQKLAQAHVALAALSLTHSGAHHRGWNSVLQYYVVNREYPLVLNAVRSMQSQDLPLTLHSLALLRRYLIPERRPGKRPVQSQKVQTIDTLALIRSACFHTAGMGHFIPVNLWEELLKRYGMTHRWAATESLVLWLFDHYCKPRPPQGQGLIVYRYLGRHLVQQRALKLRSIFGPVMLRALFTWGFRSADNLDPPGPDAEQRSCEKWARGLSLLHRLHQRNLFDVLSEARTAFQQRMWILFGAGVSKVGMNNHARLINRISLVHYINHANELWDGFVDWVDPDLLRENERSTPQLMIQFFGSVYRTKLKTSEYANVEEWAKALSKVEQSHYAQALSIREREQGWKSSPFRLSDPVLLSNLKKLESSDTSVHQAPDLSSTVGTLDINSHPPPEHQSPSARSLNSRQQPSPRYIPARP